MKHSLRLSNGQKLISPRGLSTRPTTNIVREAVMNILSYRLIGCNWLDLCSGSGVMTCEALHRGAKKVVAVERDRKMHQICKTNILLTTDKLKGENTVEVICKEAVSWLEKRIHKVQHEKKYLKSSLDRFNVVYLDPPYNSNIYLPVLNALKNGNWLCPDALVIYEHSASTEINAPKGWTEVKKRSYGQSAVLVISPQEAHCDDTDSMQRRTDQARSLE